MMSNTHNEKNSVIIIGGGLVGSLCACFMAKRGYDVKVYEYRSDIREAQIRAGRSINLSLSHRGREALKAVGLELKVLQSSVPMKGRLIHALDGKTKSILYDNKTKQCIYSVSRNYLNSILLTEAEKYPNVKLFFNHKLIDADLRGQKITVLKTNTEEIFEDKASLIIGCDGAHSMLRRLMQQTPQFQYSQKYIEHGYMEFSIPPERGDKMVKNHLHIWPRGEFMMISLPNKDGSWTVTLFMPFKRFDRLQTDEDILNFFSWTFPDAVPLIGQKELIRTFSTSKPSHLISIKCNPYHIGQHFLIIGDAAHAMVPFYGQGMNAGFEDCLLLNCFLDKYGGNFGTALAKFTEYRRTDAHEICDLAMYNYLEMRYLVTKRSFILRKKIDDLLFWTFPDLWIPLYNSITFTNMGYAFCSENRQWQNKVLLVFAFTTVFFVFFCVLLLMKIIQI